MQFKKKKIVNTLRNARDQFLKRTRLSSFPQRIHLEINNYCNIRCKMCARQCYDKDKNDADLPLSLVEKISEYFTYTTHVGLAGNGEPFLHKDLIPILRLITSKGAVPSVLTNATLFNEQRIHELMSVGPLIVSCSIDGATKETFEAIRCGAHFDKVKENLMLMHDLKQRARAPYPLIVINVCLMKENIHEIESIMQLAHESGAAHVILQNLVPYSREMEKSVVKDSALIDSTIGNARRTAQSLGLAFEYIPHSSTLERESSNSISRSKDIKDIYVDPVPGVSFYCKNIMQQIQVEVTGKVRYCCMWTRGHIGNVHNDTIPEIWNHPRFVQLRRNLYRGIRALDCAECVYCIPAKRFEHISSGYSTCRQILRMK